MEQRSYYNQQPLQKILVFILISYQYLKKKTGIKVKVVAVGTGQAIRNAKNCDADILIVHAKNDEETFVATATVLRDMI